MYVTPSIYWARVWWDQPIFVQFSNAAFYLHGANDSAYSLQIMILVMIFVVLAFVVNTATGIALWRHFSRMNNKTRKTEIRFYAMSLIMFLTQVMAVGTQFLASYLPQSNLQYWIVEVGPIFGDFNCFFPLYFLIAVSNEWRAMVFEESKQPLVSSSVRSGTLSTAISRKSTNWEKNGKETIVD
ncbi:unnamed protein product, partial [Mesorhabditis belari]|uniref:Serpentine receptor class gamma n=1 Tax=Mesorhabditis belari TaxID=2138241 RepID=A0AAF3EKD7_9BILA